MLQVVGKNWYKDGKGRLNEEGGKKALSGVIVAPDRFTIDLTLVPPI